MNKNFTARDIVIVGYKKKKFFSNEKIFIFENTENLKI